MRRARAYAQADELLQRGGPRRLSLADSLDAAIPTRSASCPILRRSSGPRRLELSPGTGRRHRRHSARDELRTAHDARDRDGARARGRMRRERHGARDRRRARIEPRSMPAGERSPCSAPAPTSRIRARTRRCTERSRERGLILSELAPGARSDAGSFPRRNRIIAGARAPDDRDRSARSQRRARSPSKRRTGARPRRRRRSRSDRLAAECRAPTSSFATARRSITSVSDALSLVGLEPTGPFGARTARER